MGASIKFLFHISKALKHIASTLNFTFFSKRLHTGLAILEKILDELHIKTCMTIKTMYPYIYSGGGNFSITSTLALSTSKQYWETLCPDTIPSLTEKWHFYQFRTKLVSSHIASTLSRFKRHTLKDIQWTNKWSMNTSTKSSTISLKISSMHLWKVAGALQCTNGMCFNK